MACSPGFGIDGVPLQPGDHICGLFYGWLDRDKLLVPFFRTGLLAGDRCVIVTDRTDPTPILRQLGPDAATDQWLASGQLQLRTSNRPARTHLVGSRPRRDAGDLATGLRRRCQRIVEFPTLADRGRGELVDTGRNSR